MSGRACCQSDCVPRDLCCDQCFVENADLYRPKCHVLVDSESKWEARDDLEDRKIRVFELNGLYLTAYDAKSGTSAEPGYDLNCSDGLKNPAKGAFRVEGSTQGACERAKFFDGTPIDSESWIDNNFARAFVPDLTDGRGIDFFDEAAQQGSWGIIVAISGYHGRPDDSSVSVTMLFADRSGKALRSEADESGIEAARCWGVENRYGYVVGANPLIRDETAHVQGDEVYAEFFRTANTWLNLVVPLATGDGRASIAPMQIRRPVLTFHLLRNETGQISGIENGVLSGIWYETDWPTDSESYRQAMAADASMSGAAGASGQEAQGGSAPSPSGASVAGTAGDLSFLGESLVAAGVGGSAERPASLPFEGVYGRDGLLSALARSMDVFIETDDDTDPTICNAISFAMGFRGAPAQIRCPPLGSPSSPGAAGAPSASFDCGLSYVPCPL